MGRRKKGRKVHGWLILDKPAGVSSNAAVNKIRWAFDAQKAGHAGTLDPEATGILAIALGEATKTIPYVTDALKAYEFTVRFGQTTNTDDAEGEVTATSDLRPADSEIAAALCAFQGDILQVPPAFSAVKIDGERAYKKARDGEELTLAARPLWVEDIAMTNRPDADHANISMTCGKGGYVRAVARDLGAALGCYAHVKTLRRIWSGPFDLDDAVTWEWVEASARSEAMDDALIPMADGLTDLPQLTCTDIAAAAIRNGNPGQVLTTDGCAFGDEAWVSCGGEPIAIGQYRAGMLHPSRVFVL